MTLAALNSGTDDQLCCRVCGTESELAFPFNCCKRTHVCAFRHAQPHASDLASAEGSTRWREGKASSCFGQAPMCNKCREVSEQPVLGKGPCEVCNIAGNT